MLELYFKYPRVLRRLRSGALGQEMDRIAAHFSELGYKRGSAKVYISRLAKFSEFAARSAGGATIEQDVIDRFVQSLRTATPRIAARTAIEHARRLAPARFSMPLHHTAPDPHGPLLGAYLDHLRQVRGLELKTCDGLLVVARRILAWYDGDVPDQPISAMTGEHVLDVTQHLLLSPPMITPGHRPRRAPVHSCVSFSGPASTTRILLGSSAHSLLPAGARAAAACVGRCQARD